MYTKKKLYVDKGELKAFKGISVALPVALNDKICWEKKMPVILGHNSSHYGTMANSNAKTHTFTSHEIHATVTLLSLSWIFVGSIIHTHFYEVAVV